MSLVATFVGAPDRYSETQGRHVAQMPLRPPRGDWAKSGNTSCIQRARLQEQQGTLWTLDLLGLARPDPIDGPSPYQRVPITRRSASLARRLGESMVRHLGTPLAELSTHEVHRRPLPATDGTFA